jgi:MFS transporter, DHA1 family, multidrug resistance protein
MSQSESAPVAPNFRTILLFSALTMLAPMSIDMFLPGLPAIGRDLGATAAQASATVSVFFAGLALGQLFFGPWSDRVGRRLPILAGLTLFCVGALISAVAPSPQVLLLGRLLQAIGGSAVMVTSRATVRDLFNEREAARFFSTLTLVAGLAPVLAPAAGAALLAVTHWRGIFLVLAAFAIAVLLAVALALRESRSAETEQRARANNALHAYGALLRQPRMIGFLIAGGCNSACYFTYLALAPLVMMNVYGLSPRNYALLLAVNAIGLVGGAQANRVLLRRWHPTQILAVASISSAFLAAGFLTVALTLQGGLGLLLPLLFLLVSSTSIIQANAMASALSVDPQRAGAAAALFGASGFGAGTVLSLLAGYFYNDSARSLTAFIALGLVGAATAMRLLTHKHTTPPQPA